MHIPIFSQEKEYKEALEAFNEKNKEKVQLITRLMEVSVTTSTLNEICSLILTYNEFILY